MMKVIQYLMIPIYALLRIRRDFDIESAGVGSKSIGSLFLFLLFNFCFDIFYLLFINNNTFSHYKFLFEIGYCVLGLISILLSFFYNSILYWQQKFEEDGFSWYSFALTIFILILLILFNVLIMLEMHHKFPVFLES